MRRPQHAPGRGPVAGAFAVAAAGGLGVWQAAAIRRPRAYQVLGPEVLPLVICTLLTGLGLGLLARATVAADHPWLRQRALASAGATGSTPIALLGAMTVYALSLGHAGWILATTGFVPGAARLLGSGRPGRDALAGAALAISSYVTFTRVLHLELPTGWLSGVSQP